MYDFDPKRAARFIADQHRTLATYQNLPAEHAPPSIRDAYRIQDELRALWTPLHGQVKGLKIATTTKVMQQLMGIDHPIGGQIYERRIHNSPADLNLGDYIHLMIECELAVRLGGGLPRQDRPYTLEDVRAAVTEVLPAFEMIEDRNAVYRETQATTLIADNAWNGGIVLGPSRRVPADLDLNGIGGRLTINGVERDRGRTDNPMGALAWVANLARDRGQAIEPGMVVITGSVVVTVPIAAGDKFEFTLDGIGTAKMTAH